jgi:hypothetical protein
MSANVFGIRFSIHCCVVASYVFTVYSHTFDEHTETHKFEFTRSHTATAPMVTLDNCGISLVCRRLRDDVRNMAACCVALPLVLDTMPDCSECMHNYSVCGYRLRRLHARATNVSHQQGTVRHSFVTL